MGAPILAYGTIGSPAFAYPAAPGFPAQYASKISNLWSNNQGDNAIVTAQSGDTLIAVAIGLKSTDPFDQLHGTNPSYGSGNAFGYLQGLNDFMPAAPTISDSSAFTPESPFDVILGTAANYALLGASAVTNSDGASTVINGGLIGSSPTPTITAGTPAWTLGTGVSVDNADAGAAQGAVTAAVTYFNGLSYTSLGGAVNLSTNIGGGGGAGVYHAGYYSAGSTMNALTSITLDAQGNPNALFVFKAVSSIGFASGASVLLVNGAQPQNVVWLAGTTIVQTGNVGATVAGTFIAGTSVTFGGGTFHGRAIAQTGAITISTAEVITVSSLGGSVNNWVLVASINLADSDYTAALPVASPSGSQYQSSKWSIDGYFPCLYVWVCASANAGTYDVNLNSVYQNGIIPPLELAAGKPIFDGGIDFFVTNFTNMSGVTVDGSSTSIDPAAADTTPPSNNPAVAAPITTTGAGDLAFVVGLQKSSNGLGLGPDVQGSPAAGVLTDGYHRLVNGRLVGSEAHYMVEWGTITNSGAAWTPEFANPLGYETLVIGVALKYS